MGEGHEMRWGGVAGVSAIVFGIIGGLMWGNAPKITDSPSTIAGYMFDHRSQIMTAVVLYAIAVALFLWFGAALATAFRRADETSDAPAVVLAGFVLVSAIAFIAASVFAGITYAITVHRGLLALAAAPYTAVMVMGTIAGIAMALPLAASAVAIARTHVFPMWMAWFAGVVAVIRVLAAFMAGMTEGVLMPGGALTTFVPGLLTALWVLAASGLLIREHLPALPARAPRAMGHA